MSEAFNLNSQTQLSLWLTFHPLQISVIVSEQTLLYPGNHRFDIVVANGELGTRGSDQGG